MPDTAKVTKIELTYAPIESERVIEQVASASSGAVVLFLGTTRNHTGDRRTRSLDYEAYGEMAIAHLTDLADQAVVRWELQGVAISHRLGHLLPAEASVAIAVSAAHRTAAFEAAQWLIDTIKESVPIWKKENWEDGTAEWAMPGINRPANSESPHGTR